MPEVTLKIKRQEPGKAGELKDYKVQVADNASVMEALLQVRDEQDGSLAVRANCMSGLCGDCLYRVNGGQQLACTQLCSKVARNGEIRVEPIITAKVQKDLVYDMDAHLWDKVKAVKPGIAVNGVTLKEEQKIDQKVIDDLQNVMSCYMCGLCDDGCTVIAVDKTFLGPAALAKAYRTVKDPRVAAADTSKILDVMELPKGAWDCAHCYEANAHCPREVTPTYRIVAVRDMLIKRGIKHGGASRHHNSAMASIKQSGWLDEGRITVDSIGWTNIKGLMAFMPVAIKALQRRKAPLPFLHPKRPGAEHIRRIMEKAERRAHE